MPENYGTASQVIYGFGNDVKPLDLGEGKLAASYDSVMAAFEKAEASIGQKILQDNQNVIRQGALITSYNFSTSYTSCSGTQSAALFNQIFTVLNNLIVQGKQ